MPNSVTPLDYQSPARKRRRVGSSVIVVALLLAGLLIGGVSIAMIRGGGPTAPTPESIRLQLDQLVSRPRDSIRAAIVNDIALQQDPHAIERMGHIGAWHDYPQQVLSEWIWTVRLTASDGWYGTFAHYPFETGANVLLLKRRDPNNIEHLVAVDMTVNGRYLEFHGTALNLQSPAIVQNAFSSGRRSARTSKLASISFTEDACYVLTMPPDADNPSRCAIAVVHGDHRDILTVMLDAQGHLTATVSVDPVRENRWRFPPDLTPNQSVTDPAGSALLDQDARFPEHIPADR